MSSEEQTLQDDKKELEYVLNYGEGVKYGWGLMSTLLVTVLMLTLTILLAYDSIPFFSPPVDQRNSYFAAYGIIGLLSFGLYVVLAWSNMKRLNQKS